MFKSLLLSQETVDRGSLFTDMSRGPHLREGTSKNNLLKFESLIVNVSKSEIELSAGVNTDQLGQPYKNEQVVFQS